MPILSLIAAVDEQYGLGLHNQLLCHLPADLKYFKKMTLGKPVIMGKNTFYSIGKALPERLNIVLSSQALDYEGITKASSLEEALSLVSDAKEIMIIGGASLYAQSLALAERIYLTKIHHRFQADVFFPCLDQSQWRCEQEEFRPRDEKNPYDLSFSTWTRISNVAKLK